MKAIVCTGYGPPEVLQLREVEEPTPKHDQVMIKIHATAATSSDTLVRTFNLHGPMRVAARLILGIRRPRLDDGVIVRRQRLHGLINEHSRAA